MVPKYFHLGALVKRWCNTKNGKNATHNNGVNPIGSHAIKNNKAGNVIQTQLGTLLILFGSIWEYLTPSKTTTNSPLGGFDSKCERTSINRPVTVSSNFFVNSLDTLTLLFSPQYSNKAFRVFSNLCGLS